MVKNYLNDTIPQHVAIVMDGNGRWAARQGLSRIEGHKAGVETVKVIIQSCLKKNIPILSLFAFSSENWTRPNLEVKSLMDLFLSSLKQTIDKLCEHKVSLRFTGCRAALSKVLQEEMYQAESRTAQNTNLILNIVINYGGRWDILNATKNIVREVVAGKLSIDDINETYFPKYLSTYNLPDPDLFIRTSGEKRISNFYLWQLAYTELYFSQAYWPDFNDEEFTIALNNFKQRERRYGNISLASQKE